MLALAVLLSLSCLPYVTPHEPSSKASTQLPRLVRTHRLPRLPLDYDAAFLSLTSSLTSLTPPSSMNNAQRLWAAHGDLANLTHLTLLHSVTIPLHVNVIALGFDGSGERTVNLTGEGLEAWLEHLDHVVRQSYVDEDDASGGFLSSPAVHRPHGLQHAAHVSYAYQFRVVSLAPSVLRVVEQTLATSYRATSLSPPDASATSPPPLFDYQVDPSLVTSLFDSLLTDLSLHTAPALIIINPQRQWIDLPVRSAAASPPRRYGYRAGLSNEEIDALVEPQSQDMRDLVKSLRDHPDIQWRADAGDEQHKPPKMGFGLRPAEEAGNVTVQQVEVVDHTEASDRWARGRLSESTERPSYPLALSAHLTRLSTAAPLSLISYLYDQYVQEDCLTEAHPSSTLPFLFLDLSAGPFAWGPTVGGAGVKTERTYPSIAVFADREKDLNLDEWRQQELDADSVRAEKILVEGRLVQAQCDSPAQQGSDDCQSLKETWQALNAMDREFKRRVLRQAKQERTINASLLHRNALSYFRSDDDDDSGGRPPLQHDEHLESNHFLSHLSSTLSTALHHLVTPSLAHPSATQRYAATVTFHLFLLTDHERYDPAHGHLVSRLRHGVEQLRMEGQTFSFQVHRMSVSDEPMLAMAYTNSLRSAVVPTLMHDGHFSAIKRMYLDTAVLLHELVRFTPDLPPPPVQGTFAARSISIFLFSMDYPLPVFLDRTYVSRAFPAQELVIATQSSYHLYESAVSCNHAPVYVNLNYPFHSLLHSIVRLLTATLPHHLAHSSPHAPSSQWAMSVGGSVLTPLSSGHTFSALERRAIQRSYLVLHLTEFTHQVNLAVLRLQDTPLSPSSSSLHTSPRWRRMVSALEQEHAKLMQLAELMTVLIEGGRLEMGVAQLPSMAAMAKQFEGKVRLMISMVEDKECENVARVEGMLGGEVLERRRLGLGRWRWTCYLLCILVCLLMVTYRAVQWQLKPKSN